MDMTTPSSPGPDVTGRALPAFAAMGTETLVDLRAAFRDLHETLADIRCIAGAAATKKIRRMESEIDTFSPAVTFIGQIKSGKTTLVNAVAGRPGLLPADVNPWTSVVTSLHLNAPRRDDEPAASFRFFDADEWDHLVQNGGRIGELSARAGADKEFERLRVQIAEMREKTKERLGRKFELLLGQVHDYRAIDDDLIQRYVCLGDDFDTEEARNRQGQFADITKSADLFLDGPHLPIPLTLRDTPGMNDTFMMRERITIRSIRDSKICVVVLSAHQALNSVDMGLIRLISNVKSRQIVIFVNRVDELSDPAAQIPEIRDSLAATLVKHNGPEDTTIVFGSAMWANAALTDTLDDMPEASLTALENLRAVSEIDGLAEMEPRAAAWALSGVPALFAELGERIVESSGDALLQSVRRRAGNMVAGLKASSKIVSLRANGEQLRKMSPADLAALMDRIEADAKTRLDEALDQVFTAFSARVDQAHASFINRALDALLRHLELRGDNEVWNYSPDGLRILIRGAYQVMRSKFTRECGVVLGATATRLTDAYGDIFDVTSTNFRVEAPEMPEIPPPVALGQTIVLDVKTSWWKSWWGQRKGYRAFASGFRDLIEAETAPMVDELRVTQVEEIRAMAHGVLDGFLQEQRGILDDICAKADISIEDLHGVFGTETQDEREELLALLFEELEIEDEATGDAA